MAVDARRVFWLGIGILSGIGVSYCIAEIRRVIRGKCKRRRLSLLENAICLDDLATLARSPNVSLRRSAEQLILDRATKDSNLEFILNACSSPDETQVLKGVTVVGVLVKSTDFKGKLIKFNILETLAYCLDYSLDPGYPKLVETGGQDVRLQRIITSALFDLICDDDALKERLGKSSPTIVRSILHLMLVSRSKEVMRWCIFVSHQFALNDAVRPQLVANDAIVIVSQLVVKNQGDNVLMRLLLQTLVMCASSSEDGEVQALHEMAKQKIIQPTVACLKADDSDLVYWATALIHEYSVKDLYKDQICSIPNIVKLLQGVLSTSEAILQRIVLRVLSFLCVGNQEFRNKVLQCNPLLTRLSVCFASGDDDVVHWAVVLLHDLLLSSGSPSSASKNAAEKVINVCEGIITSLVSLTHRKENLMVRLVAEIIGFFCSVDFPSELLQNHLVSDGALEAVLSFLQSSDPDLQYWSSALLLNLSMTSDSVKEEIVKLGGIKFLIELAISDADQHSVAAQSAKTLVMLGFIDKQVSVTLKVAGPRRGDSSTIIFNGKECCSNECGLNVCVLDVLTFSITHMISYDTNHDTSAAAAELIEGIESIPCGALVFVTVKGDAASSMTDEVVKALEKIGNKDYIFKAGEQLAFVGQKKQDHSEQIGICSSNEHVLLDTGISLGHYVNELVDHNILLPVIDLMMTTPPSSAISKVSELELLTIMARHNYHKQVMVGIEGFLEYLAELNWNVSSKSGDYLRHNPMFLAHCIGALKIISAISVSEAYHENLLTSGVLSSVLTLMYFINGIALLRANQSSEQESLVLSPKRHQDPDVFGPVSTENPKPHPLDDVSFDEQPKSSPVSRSESSSTPDDFDDAFSTITRLAITTVYNCMRLFAGCAEPRESLVKSSTLRTLWCTLLTSNEATLAQIGLPVEALLNTIGCMESLERDIPDNMMELNEALKTPALVLSTDHLEAYNMNWTFESTRATFSIGRSRYLSTAHPLGWYYEVILKSSGILQIGWQTEECLYGPEKGIGVGDDHSSCAFDGARCKVWNGPPSEQHNNDYGTEWQDGDVLSCLFFWKGDVSFWLNGVDQGVAFTGMTVNIDWFPAASLAMDQHCVFNFGSKPFRYEMSEGFVAVSHVLTHGSCQAQQKVPSRTMPSWTNEQKQQNFEESSTNDMSSNSALEKNPSSSSHFSLESPTPDGSCALPNKPPPGEGHNGRPTTLPDGSTRMALISPTSECDNNNSDMTTMTPPVSNISVTSTPEQSMAHALSPGPATPMSLSGFESGGEEVVKSGAESSWLHFSPGESLCTGYDEPSFPCLYYEAELKNAPSNSKHVGFFDPKTGDNIYCEILDGQLYLPKTSPHTPSHQECYKCPEVVGCGIMWPAAVVIFTLDGVGTGQYYNFPCTKSLDINNLLPYISCSRTRCNYGQRSFLFEGANFKEVSYAGANLLHAHGLSS